MIASVVLICGVVASLALGVLLAQGLCVVMFAVLKMRTRRVAARAPRASALETAGN